jgi:hypothetical protein
MSVFRLGVAAVLFAFSACNPFRSNNAVELDTSGATAGSQWNATLNSPSALAGAVQMNGTASMAPSSDSTSTIVTIDLANASPGGAHPWEVRRGECGAAGNAATFGSKDAYEPLDVDSDGLASSSTTIDSRIPTTGRYFVVVHASASNATTIVACGNFATPTR